MREAFREWYPPTPSDVQRAWQEGRVVLDTSALLELYLYPPRSLQDFLAVLDRIKDQLWMPHQVGLEYHRLREHKLPEQRRVLDQFIEAIQRLQSNASGLVVPEHHPTLDITETTARRDAIDSAIASLISYVTQARDSTPPPDPDAPDSILDTVTNLFDGKIGPPFATDELKKVHDEAAKRYAAKIPPGFRDAGKDDQGPYGDFVIWKQLLLEAANANPPRPTILVTNDRKDDWWRRRHAQLVGPRTELVREHYDMAHDLFILYTPEQFLGQAQAHLDLSVSPGTIAEVQRISESSPVRQTLRAEQMTLPNLNSRIAALTHIHTSLRAGKIQSVPDLNTAIQSIGPEFTDASVATPFFFSLINEAYGLVQLDQDPARRLRDRTVESVGYLDSQSTFVEMGHAAWIAQALFRLRLESYTQDELLTALFGEDYPPSSHTLLQTAYEMVQRDYARRGIQP
jgi:hypothetical protein